MSKTKLKKELQTLDRDQLVEVLLSTYTASPGAKEYLEFFLNPDIDSLVEKKLKTVTKELSRSKYGYCKARISQLEKVIKEFAAFGVGAEYVADLVLRIFTCMLIEERWVNFTPTLVSGTGRMVARYIIESEKAGRLKEGLEKLRDIYKNKEIGREGYRAYIPAWVRNGIAQLPPGTVLPEVDFTK